MASNAAEAQLAPPLTTRPQLQHAQKPSADELFEHRWRKAYEVRALERESRKAESQNHSHSSSVSSACGAGPTTTTAVSLEAAAGQVAAATLSRLALASNGSAPGTAQGYVEAAPAPTAAGPEHLHQQQQARPRPQEIIDDEEDLGAAAQPAAAAALQEGAAEEEDGGPEIRLVWDGSSARPGSGVQAPLPVAAGGSAAADLKQRGNACIKAGDWEGAVECYTLAIAAADMEAAPAADAAADAAPLRATLHSNRAHALLKLGRNAEAATDALAAHRLHPAWSKPLYRLAQARLALGHWEAVVAACKKGEPLVARSSEGHTQFTPLLDRAAVAAARAGSLAGFDGQQLEVRCAGDEAWLGGPAPHVPELDGPLDEDAPAGVGPALALPNSPTSGHVSGSGGGSLARSGAAAGVAAGASSDPLVAWDFRRTAAAAARRTSFRCVREAVVAARDGDRILLRRGVHNGMGECVTLAKRVLVEGEGALGETTIDQRANCPTFRVVRGGVVLRNLDIDQSGFREALLVDGGAAVAPLIQDCRVKCSGDDAVNIGGAAAPSLLRCTLTAKKVGLKAYGTSAPRLEGCRLETCGEQGLRAHEAAAAALHGCAIAECGEEAAVAMDTARLSLTRCTLRDCKGPGVDLSGSARATLIGGTVEACVGGVWLWDAARAELRGGAHVAGGPSHALLVDGAAAVEVRDSGIAGSVHATEAAWAGILHPSNRLDGPEGPTDFPPEEGPFRFTPNRFTRKQ